MGRQDEEVESAEDILDLMAKAEIKAVSRLRKTGHLTKEHAERIKHDLNRGRLW